MPIRGLGVVADDPEGKPGDLGGLVIEDDAERRSCDFLAEGALNVELLLEGAVSAVSRDDRISKTENVLSGRTATCLSFFGAGLERDEVDPVGDCTV